MWKVRNLREIDEDKKKLGRKKYFRKIKSLRTQSLKVKFSFSSILVDFSSINYLKLCMRVCRIRESSLAFYKKDDPVHCGSIGPNWFLPNRNIYIHQFGQIWNSNFSKLLFAHMLALSVRLEPKYSLYLYFHLYLHLFEFFSLAALVVFVLVISVKLIFGQSCSSPWFVVFVPSAKTFFQFDKCIFPNFEMYLSKIQTAKQICFCFHF